MRKFYTIAGTVIIVFLVNASLHLFRVWGNQQEKEVQKYETLSYKECIRRYQTSQKEMSEVPQTPERYFEVLGHAYNLEGSIRKGRANMGFKAGSSDGRFASFADSVLPVFQSTINQYSDNLGKFKDTTRVERAGAIFETAGLSPINSKIPADYSGVAFWWYLFHLSSIPLVFIHNIIQLRRRRCSILLEVFGNPMFPIWLFFWEIGIFMYPKRVNPMKQLRRAKQFAAMVFCSAVSCVAGTHPTCEKKEQTPQHQRYDGPQIHYALETKTLSGYLGLSGGMFHDAPVQQSSITVLFPCGVYANLWDSEPLGQRALRPNFGRENDYAVGWGGKVNGVSLDLSFTYFNVFPLSQMPDGDVIQFSETVSRPIVRGKNAIEPYLWVRELWPVKNGEPASGTFVHTGIKYGRNFRGMKLNANPEIVYDSGAFGNHKGYIGRFLSDLTWKLGKGFSLQLPIFRYSTPISHTGDGRKSEISFGMGFAFSH
jgi:hypothetical protein